MVFMGRLQGSVPSKGTEEGRAFSDFASRVRGETQGANFEVQGTFVLCPFFPGV